MLLKQLKVRGKWRASGWMAAEPGADDDIAVSVQFRVEDGALVFEKGWRNGCAIPAADSWVAEAWLTEVEEDICSRLGL